MTPSDPWRGEYDEASGADGWQLFVVRGASSWCYPLPPSGSVIIGRSEAADLRIDDAPVSRQHAQLSLDGNTVAIRDLGSHNGTFVNRVRLTGERVLAANDVVLIHHTMLICQGAAPPISAAMVLDMAALVRRIAGEVDRTAGGAYSFSLLCLVGFAPNDRLASQGTVVAQLRRGDALAWSADHALYVLLPDASHDESVAIATRIRGKLDGSLQIGCVTCPTDGGDAELLIGRAQAAALAQVEVVEVEAPRQTLLLGSQRVIVADPTVARLYALVERLAPAAIPVLIAGETGCGKELVATALHTRSRRVSQRLISLNCAALHETLVESELFGHEKGAFSGAVATKPGLIEAASGSTLFLDEIGELTLANQAKLLRVLETHRVTRLGDVREREVDVRFVAATNRDLEADVDAGRFRRDLYFRLSAATLYLPPLRQRPHELPLLAAEFLDQACRASGRQRLRISDGAMAMLQAHSWPGNVRELKNLMQYLAATLAADELLAGDLSDRLGRLRPAMAAPIDPAGSGEMPRFRPLADEMRELEITRIRDALAATGGNQTRAASLLAMPVRTFFEKAKQHRLTPKKKPPDL